MTYRSTDPVVGIDISYDPFHGPWPVRLGWTYTRDGMNHVKIVPADSETWEDTKIDNEFRSLQSLYSDSPSRLRTPDGQVTPITLHHAPDGLTLDNMADWGFYNPLILDGWDKFVNQRRCLGVLQERATPTSSSIALKAQFYTERELLPGGGLVSLSNWNVTPGPIRPNIYDSNEERRTFSIRLTIPIFEEHILQEAHNYGPIAGMRTWLNGRRTLGSSISGSLDTSVNSHPWGAPSTHRYRVTEADGTGGFQFVITSSVSAAGSDGHLRNYYLICHAVGTGFDADLLQRRIHLIPNVLVDTRVYVEHRLGKRESPADASVIRLSDEVDIDAIGGVPRIHITDPANSTPRVIPVGMHGIVDHDDMEATYDNGIESYRTMPTLEEAPMAAEVHHYGAVATHRLLKPSQANGYGGVVRPWKVDNQGDGVYHVQYPDGSNLVTLRPRQTADLRFVVDREGGGRILGSVADRVHQITHGAETYLWPGSTLSLDTNSWMMMPTTPTEIDYNDNDAFRTGTEDALANTADYVFANLPFSREALKVIKSGLLDFSQYVTIRHDGSGNVPAHHTEVRVKRGTTEIIIPVSSYADYNGAGTPRTYIWRWRSRVEKDDIIYPWLIYPKGTTLNFGTAAIVSFIRTATLVQDVFWEETE